MAACNCKMESTFLPKEVVSSLEKLQLAETVNNRTPTTRVELHEIEENRLCASNFMKFLEINKIAASTPQSTSSYLAEMRQRRKKSLNRTAPYFETNSLKAPLMETISTTETQLNIQPDAEVSEESLNNDTNSLEMPSSSTAAASAAANASRLEDITQLSPEYLQRKLYFLVDQLKKMHAQLSENYQLRISYELLTELANSLLNDTIFEIVKGLMEIQHVTEKHLQQLREQVENEYQIEVQEWISKISDPEELEHILALMKIKHTKKLKETDMKLIALLDQKVRDQQSILQKAGVAGFYVTENPKEIKIQMFLLDFILRLSRVKFEPNK